MSRFYNVNQNELIEKVADKLKQDNAVQPPVWSAFVRTGVHKQRVPDNPDWWYVRSAAVLRKVATHGPIGVAKLRTVYGGKKRRGHKPAEFRKGSGNILRKVLQQLEKSQLVRMSKQGEFGVHKGRIVTPQGQSMLDSCANELLKAAAKNKPMPPPAKEAAPKKQAAPKEQKQAKPEAKKAPEAPKEEKKEAPKAEAKAEQKPAEAKNE